MKTKIINLFGGPGAGKSTTASGLFYELKKHRINVELASEWIKDKVFEGSSYPFKDELYTFAKQNKKLRQMVGKCNVIISDSPLPLTILYSTEEPMPIFSNMVMTYFNRYENINYFIQRNYAYVPLGRIQSTEDEAIQLSEKLEEFLTNAIDIEYKVISSTDAVDLILEDLIVRGLLK